MKSNWKKYSLTEIINSNKTFSLLLSFVFSIFFSICRSVNKLISPPNGKIVIIALHKLGDTIFSIPAVKEIRKKYGKEIIIVCYPESVPIFKLEFTEVEYITLKHQCFYFGRRLAGSAAKKKLGKIKCGLVADLTGTMVSASLIFSIRCRKIIGINGRLFKSIYDDFIEIRTQPKLTDIYLDAISPIIDIDKRADVREKYSTTSNGKILIHPFAAWNEKEWSLKNYIHLAQMLKTNYKVALLTPPNHINNDLSLEIHNSELNVIETKTTEELLSTINECALFIGNDSGPINIANFLGKPTLTIYGSTNPDYTATDYDHQKYIQKKLPCSAGTSEKYCIIGIGIYSCSGTQCMNILTIDEVYNLAVLLMKRYCVDKV